MSISDEISHRVNEGRLFPLTPMMPPEIGALPRKMYVSKEIYDLLTGPWENEKWESRCGSLNADLDRFINGELITVAERPFVKGKTAYIKQLYRRYDEVWEIRSRDPAPGIRVFGRFAETDVFIATTWWLREELGGPKSRPWRDAMVGCKTEWTKLFPAHDPIKNGENDEYPSKYISSNTYLI